MKLRFPLYSKILVWFFLNLVLLAVIFLVLARGQLHFGLDFLISGPAGNRLQTVQQDLTAELRDRPRADWNDILKRYSDAWGVQFYLFSNNREQVAGPTVKPPDELWNRAAGPGPRPGDRNGPNFPMPGADHAPPFDQSQLPPPPPGARDERRGPMPPDDRRFMLHDSGLYWVVMHIRIPNDAGPPRPEPLLLIAASKSLSGGGLFFDLTSWLIGAAAIITLSALFWLPLVRGITHSISRMTAATEKIAEGNFEVRAGVRRHDELGQLSDAINRMADRLAGFVTGQKRFLGDIAHELTSPIARIQVALGILEQRADPAQKEYLADLREEVEQMTALVNELLSFSKASISGTTVKLQPVPLRALCQKAADRECASGQAEIQNQVPENFVVQADPDLLARAIGNILRNAIHYAAKSGPITIAAARTADTIQLTIDDSGPGIPEEALARVFDPFYRVDTSRTRETGGVGLGLSIVKTCIQSCSGTVHCENRQPHGLRVVVQMLNEQNRIQTL